MIKRLSNAFLKQSDWKTMMLIKPCLISFGIMIGIILPEGVRETVLIIALVIFLITYLPLLIKIVRIMRKG